ncbi:hypothetical protein IJV79_03240, partial [bacterium]|nr:hypothetical protein [bacterium]
APVVNKDFLQDMQGYYENEMKRSELSKENVISSKIYYEHYDNNPAKQIRSFDLGGKTYYEVDEE